MSETNTNDLDTVSVGDIIKGTVVKLEEKQAFVDIGLKSEGIIPISEISNLHIEHPSDVLKEGEEITLKIKKVEEDDVILSKKAVEADHAWAELEEKYKNNEIIETEVKEVVKGGLVVDVGLRGFIPASLVETYYVEDFSEYKNKPLTVKIIDLDKEQNRVILSHRAVVEEEMEEKRKEVLRSIEVGQVLEGTVQRITNFGAFVDVGGVDGLVHISELAHEHVDNASDVVTEGETISVEVLSIDLDTERISLSRKNTLPGPWSGVEERISKGDVVEGTVRRLVDFGAFIEIEPGVEGLVHISQIANRHIATPHEVLKEGDKINVKVLDVSEEKKRMSLSLKDLEENDEKEQYQSYTNDEDQSSFQLGDLIGDKLNKYKQ